MSNKYTVYICEYETGETLFSRHFLTGISSCRKIGEIAPENLSETLPLENTTTLLQREEITITDPTTLEKILTMLNFTSKQVEAILSKPYPYIRLLKS